MSSATIVDVARDSDDPTFLGEAHSLLFDLVTNGAALGWVDPPSLHDVAELLTAVGQRCATSDAAIRGAYAGGRLVGIGYWRRYERPTHAMSADLEKIAVRRDHQGQGIGRRLLAELICAARAMGIEILTLDLRADNVGALSLYESMGFERYGYLRDFVAVRHRRYDKHFLALHLRDGITDIG
jgi:ribosomal protein S18 acetylase RimI-like enzyme